MVPSVFTPNSRHRAAITIKPQDKVVVTDELLLGEDCKGKKRASMTWAQCLKRALKIDIEICEICKGPAKVIACITDPIAINQILEHLKLKEGEPICRSPASRAPPVSLLN